MTSTELATYYKSVVDLTDASKSYNLPQAYEMKLALQNIEAMESDLAKMKKLISDNYARTIGEYREADILESDGLKIVVAKIGRASLNLEKFKTDFEEVYDKVKTVATAFDEVRFKSDNFEEWEKYQVSIENVTLTDIRKSKKLTPDQEESITIRGESTYDVVKV
jgi:predicted phage-related endonuclease